MQIYIILISAIIIGSFLFKKKKKSYLFIICILMSIIAVLRNILIGNDTLNYYRTFSSIVEIGNEYFLSSRLESGYLFLNLFFSYFSKDFNAFLITISLFINFSICYTIFKESKNPTLSLLLFIFLRLFFNEMNIVRQYIAIAIVLFSLKYVKNRNLVKFILCILLASTFHTSAIAAILLYFLYGKLIEKNMKIIIYVVSIILFLFLDVFLNIITSKLGHYSSYIDTYNNSYKLGNVLMFILILIT